MYTLHTHYILTANTLHAMCIHPCIPTARIAYCTHTAYTHRSPFMITELLLLSHWWDIYNNIRILRGKQGCLGVCYFFLQNISHTDSEFLSESKTKLFSGLREDFQFRSTSISLKQKNVQILWNFMKESDRTNCSQVNFKHTQTVITCFTCFQCSDLRWSRIRLLQLYQTRSWSCGLTQTSFNLTTQ